jgi:hypothetical protein
MQEVVRQLGYTTTTVARRTFSGMEIDIEARGTLSHTPLYAECKCYAEPLGAPAYQQFFAKYIARWGKDHHAQGLFIAIPAANGAAWAFHEDEAAAIEGTTLRIIEQDEVVDLMVRAKIVPSESTVGASVRVEDGSPGDRFVIYTNRGAFWAQLVIRPEQTTPTAVLLLDSTGRQVGDESFFEILVRLHPEFDAFEWLTPSTEAAAIRGQAEPQDDVVQVKGSASYFEYQFPSSPEFFVGRADFLARVEDVTAEILARETSSRSLLIEAASGWGKSSFVLAAVQHLRANGHFAVSIDSRSASSSQFILRVVSRLRADVEGLDALLQGNTTDTIVTGFEGAIDVLTKIDRALQEQGKLLVLFFDQFENVFFLPEVLQRIHDVFARTMDRSGNIIFGFAWKTDLVGVMDDFPFEKRDSIRRASRIFPLPRFGEEETNAMLDQLRSEMRVSSLRQDLRFLIADFSQGFPWLLKKLCAHVKVQRLERGVSQADIATSVLNVEELFKEDLEGLSAREEEVLRAIAKAAPMLVSELGDEFDPVVVQSLVNQRLVMRIANKYDIYWDIFRDFLNHGRLPVQENYILRLSTRSVLSRVKLLSDAGGALDLGDFASKAGVGRESLYNVARDMRVLGLASVDDGSIRLRADLGAGEGFDASARVFIQERLRRNRMVRAVLEQLDEIESLSVEKLAELMADLASYVSATESTWQQYARALADWLDFADLAVFDVRRSTVRRLAPGAEVRQRGVSPVQRRSELTIPRVQYTPVATAAVRLVEAAIARRDPEWSGLSDSTVSKALGVLTDLGFLSRQGASLILEAPILSFYEANTEGRAELFAKRALRLKPFAEFVTVLGEHADTGMSNQEVGRELSSRLGFDWKDGTAETNAKIMMDWARHTGLAPGVFSANRRGGRRAAERTLPLLESHDALRPEAPGFEVT